MQLIRAKDYEDLSRRSANFMAAQILLKPHCVMGLATGSTPVGIYRQLIRMYKRGDGLNTMAEDVAI